MLADLNLEATLFASALIFARIGAILMLLPGFGEPYVNPRIRLAFALAFGLALGPMLAPALPSMPASLSGMAGILILEAIIGLMIGAAARLFLASASVAGQIIGYQTGLAMAQSFDPSQGQQGALPAAFLNLTFIVLLFATNLHHLLLQATAGSYEMLPVGEVPIWEDAAAWIITLFVDAFIIGVQIASPLIVFGLVFYLGLGVLSRMMPQTQIFFIAMPLNILFGFMIMAIALGAMSLVWLERIERFAITLM